MATELRVGRHPAAVVDGDILHVRWSGELSASDLRALMQWGIETTQARGAAFYLGDMEGVTGIPPEARKALMEYRDVPTFAGSSMYGGPFRIRMLTELVINAFRILSPSAPPAQIFAKEPDARAWLLAHREGLRARPRGA
jgi:hypothetical protein